MPPLEAEGAWYGGGGQRRRLLAGCPPPPLLLRPRLPQPRRLQAALSSEAVEVAIELPPRPRSVPALRCWRHAQRPDRELRRQQTARRASDSSMRLGTAKRSSRCTLPAALEAVAGTARTACRLACSIRRPRHCSRATAGSWNREAKEEAATARRPSQGQSVSWGRALPDHGAERFSIHEENDFSQARLRTLHEGRSFKLLRAHIRQNRYTSGARPLGAAPTVGTTPRRRRSLPCRCLAPRTCSSCRGSLAWRSTSTMNMAGICRLAGALGCPRSPLVGRTRLSGMGHSRG